MFRKIIDAAGAGDAEAAREVLKIFVAIVEEIGGFKRPEQAWTGPIPWEIADYFAHAFRRTLGKGDDGKRVNADTALNLSTKGTRGKKKKKATRKDSLLRGKAVWDAYRADTGRKDFPSVNGRDFDPDQPNDTPIERAIGIVANKENKSPHTIRRDYMAWRKLWKDIAPGT